MDFLLKVLPIEDMGQPSEGITKVEEDTGQLPGPAEGVDEEGVVGQGDEGVVHTVGVLEVHGAVLDVVARVQKQLTITVELQGVRWLVNFVCALEILSGTLGQLSLGGPDDFMEVLNLAETSGGLLHEASMAG